ncbi:MAG: SDR family oxidoreductase [Acidobacteria bacterium]|nr:SDR family oxidoreductase [Acidobacteriota bacterium]
MSNPFDFTGKVVFVSGGTSGINLGIAHAFASRGAKVAVISRSQDKVDAAVNELKNYGGEVIGFSADVRDYAKIKETLTKTHEQFGLIDILVSGAAGNFPAPAMGMSANGFKSVVDIDLQGTFHVFHSAFEFLTKPGACLINISAPQAYNPMELQIHVCAAKAGVDMITRVAAMEWGAMGIRVNSVAPGPIDDTEGMKRLAASKEARQLVIDSVPLARYGTKQEIADVCLWLASPMASYVTGVILPVDGGWSLGGTSVSSAGMKKALLSKGI